MDRNRSKSSIRWSYGTFRFKFADKISMASETVLEAVHTVLRDLMQNNIPLERKFVIIGEDSLQITKVENKRWRKALAISWFGDFLVNYVLPLKWALDTQEWNDKIPFWWLETLKKMMQTVA
ncbi:unnamed protein product [Nippostrongylus brasiliensis]|uniref:RNase H domain-containing protein n=1 Tax=Nippostrongylus brasiliensis TaxID=27835 RepID=A0A0N4YMD7_NIPBR|nr:unnamed protein product [Nippostrongylus brasiliensis]